MHVNSGPWSIGRIGALVVGIIAVILVVSARLELAAAGWLIAALAACVVIG
ncbi:MAG: hypothetical protein ACRENL_05635 [Candidatus Dormibacteria bacterium]